MTFSLSLTHTHPFLLSLLLLTYPRDIQTGCPSTHPHPCQVSRLPCSNTHPFLPLQCSFWQSLSFPLQVWEERPREEGTKGGGKKAGRRSSLEALKQPAGQSESLLLPGRSKERKTPKGNQVREESSPISVHVQRRSSTLLGLEVPFPPHPASWGAGGPLSQLGTFWRCGLQSPSFPARLIRKDGSLAQRKAGLDSAEAPLLWIGGSSGRGGQGARSCSPPPHTHKGESLLVEHWKSLIGSLAGQNASRWGIKQGK